MSSLLPQLLSFPPQPPPATPYTDNEYDSHIRLFLEGLSKIPAKKLTQDVSDGDDLLEVLDPSINTLPYLYAILAQVNSSSKGKQAAHSASSKFQPGTRLWKCLLRFLHHYDPVQIRYVGNEIRSLLDHAEIATVKVSQPLECISILSLALRRLDPSGSTLTSMHLTLASTALRARAFQESTAVLKHDIRYLPTTSDKFSSNPLHPYPCSAHSTSTTYITYKSGLTEKLDYREYLRYHLYGAMIYVALKEWDRALLFLEIIISAPTNNTASLIQVEAYRKWVLVCLIANGKHGVSPSTTSSQANRLCQSLSRAYDGVAKVFEESLSKYGNASRLLAECEAGKPVWKDDGNEGLVHHVVEAYRRFSLTKLGSIFAAMPMPLVAQHTSQTPDNVAETATYVSHLIDTGQLHAYLENSSDPNACVVKFLSPSSKLSIPSDTDRFAALSKEIERIRGISGEARLFDREIGVSKESIAAAKKRRAATENENTNGTGDMDMDQTMEEDIMGDIY